MRLRLTLEATGGTTTGFVVPDDVVAGLDAGRRPKVVVTVGEHTWHASIASMGGRFLLGVSKAHRDAAGVEAGQSLDVDLELDTAERIVEVPDDLAAALSADPDADRAWQAWSLTRRKEAARTLVEAKQLATRERRLAKILAALSD